MSISRKANRLKHRFLEFLEAVGEDGVTQQEIARRLGVPPQYVSDVKTGRRSLTELFARRINEHFGVDYEWLLGGPEPSDAAEMMRAAIGDRAVRLPIFRHPIQGNPYAHHIWDGSDIEISGPAVPQIIASHLPYVLRFGAIDRMGRLRKHDLVLISQTNVRGAEIQVLKAGEKMFLARKTGATGWEAVAAGKQIQDKPIEAGHCIGILWGSLQR